MTAKKILDNKTPWGVPERIANSSVREAYQGHELRPYTGRPGAMDAHRLPSLINGQLTYSRTAS